MAGYIRQDTSNNIADGNVINSSDFDNEYNAIEAAFHATTGHTHDGTSAEGAPITKMGPAQDLVVGIAAVTPKTDNTLDLGSSLLEFKDLYIDGTANIDSLVADTADINAGTIDGTTIGGSSAAAGTFTTATATTGNITTVNATTVDTTNLEVTTLKAKDGTSAGSIADSTGVVTLASSVLTTTDINGGTIDGVTIGGASAGAGTFTTLTTSSTVTLNGGTANGVLYLDGSKVATSGSALTFDGSRLSVGAGTALNVAGYNNIVLNGSTGGLLELKSNDTRVLQIQTDGASAGAQIATVNNGSNPPLIFGVNSTEQMRLTSTGLGIGTSSPTQKLTLVNNAASTYLNTTDNTVNTIYGTSTGLSAGLLGTLTNHPLVFYANNAERMRLDSSGNLGLGVTPSSSLGGWKSFEIGGKGQQWFVNTNSLDWHITGNAFYSGGWKYGVSGPASDYEQNGGAHLWYTAPSGTAGDPISFTQAMTLTANSELIVGTTSTGGALRVYGSSGKIIIGDSSFNYFDADTQLFRNFAGTERMRLDSSGNLGLGVTPSAWGSGYSGLQLGLGLSLMGSSVNGNFAANCYFDGTNWRYVQNTFANNFYVNYANNGSFVWATAPSGTAGTAISFTQAMTLDASGNLGVGTTSPQSRLEIAQSADNTDGPKLRIANNGNTLSNGQLIGGIDFFDGDDSGEGVGAYIYSYTTDSIARASGQDLRFATGGTTERMRLDASGNLGLGVTPSAWGASKFAIQIGSRASLYGANNLTVLGNNYYDNGTNNIYIDSAAATDYYQSGGSHVWRTAPSGTAGAAISFTQAMTLDASGNLLVGTTSTGGRIVLGVVDTGTAIVYKWPTSGSSGGTAAYFEVNSSNVGTITCSTTATSYNTSSDYRLKNTIAPMTGALAKVQALKPVTYKWNADGSDGEGFIAHELAEVCPQAVTGEKDAVDADGNPVYQGIDTSFLVATLTAAIKEQQALITALTARVAALETN